MIADDRGGVVLAVTLAAIAEESEHDGAFGVAEVWRAVRHEIAPPPTRDEIADALGLLSLPMLGGVVSVTEGEYRPGAPAEVVTERLRRLANAVRESEGEQEDDDRY